MEHRAHLISNCLFGICSLSVLITVIVSCATTKEKILFKTAPGFDPTGYINPEDYGYDLEIDTESEQNLADTSVFIPATIKGNRREWQSLVAYPREARMQEIEGTVILGLFIDSTGTLQKIIVVQSPHEILTQSSARAIITAQFNPARLNDKPVDSYIQTSSVFRMVTISVEHSR